MARQCRRRGSSGCVDVGVGLVRGDWVERRGSGRPGAEGAPEEEGCVVVRLVVEVGWEAEGVMRRDWWGRGVVS